jgi:hypothetical protein
VTPEIVLLNAHDGTSAYQFHAGLFRLVCANGLIVSDATLSPEFRLAYAREALVLRYADGTAPIAPTQLLTARRLEDRLPDLFTTFNMVQEHLLRGRLPGQRADGRAVRTRRITAVTETLRPNKALWALTADYAEARN